MPDDAALLKTFLQSFSTLMEFAYEHRSEAMPIHLRVPLEFAWPEFITRMNKLQYEFSELDAERLSALREHGLTGDELRLKLAGFNASYDRFNNLKDSGQYRRSASGDRSKPLSWPKRVFGSLGSLFRSKRVEEEKPKWLQWLYKALNWADIIIGSIPEALFPGKGAVEEIKKVVERGMKTEMRLNSPSLLPYMGVECKASCTAYSKDLRPTPALHRTANAHCALAAR